MESFMSSIAAEGYQTNKPLTKQEQIRYHESMIETKQKLIRDHQKKISELKTLRENFEFKQLLSAMPLLTSIEKKLDGYAVKGQETIHHQNATATKGNEKISVTKKWDPATNTLKMIKTICPRVITCPNCNELFKFCVSRKSTDDEGKDVFFKHFPKCVGYEKPEAKPICPICKKLYKNKNSMNAHRYRDHK